jgi:hypothetical protein
MHIIQLGSLQSNDIASLQKQLSYSNLTCLKVFEFPSLNLTNISDALC